MDEHNSTPLQQLPAWQKLSEHFSTVQNAHIADFFRDDPQRFELFSLEDCGLLLDYSKNRVSPQTLTLLLKLAEECQLAEAIDDMFSGKNVNPTEDRPALHIALRNRSNRPILVDNQDVMPGVNAVLERMRAITEEVRSGKWRGYSGKAIRHIVNIGIGGSDLGPLMVVNALIPYVKDGLQTHFVSNIDPSNISDILKQVDAETTLFVVVSKSFSTQETITNALTARQWLLENGATEADVCKHFLAVSTNSKTVQEFGIDLDNMFEIWDWVGGRYSLWSAVGLSIALAIGMDEFEELLSGAHAMDEHFRNKELASNMPVIMAMLGVWYINFFAAETHAVLPYDDHLRYLPPYLQQADMESNGKRITKDGHVVDYQTGPVVWGQLGNNGQHAFYQLIHQGTHLIPADFIASVQTPQPIGQHHDILLANFFAQTEALANGKDEATVRKELEDAGLKKEQVEALVTHKAYPGNQPTNSIMMPSLTPRALGSLIALYEHKIFVQSVIWGINPFDQWGVELGKQLTGKILSELAASEPVSSHDPSTNGLINYYKKHR